MATGMHEETSLQVKEYETPILLAGYLDRIGKDKLLTSLQERELSRRAKAGDERARQRLIEKNLRLVVLVRRYGLDDRDPATLAELAAELKLSRERVRQLQREAEFLLKSGTRRVPRPSVV